MNLKTFAQQSRTLLMEGVAQKLLYWGFDDKGNVLEELRKISGGYLLRGEPYDDPHVPKLWDALKQAIQKKGVEVVVEEAAYTWFNRMMAIRILSKNGYDEAQLKYVEGMEHTPVILQRARQGSYDFLTDDEQQRIERILKDYTKDQEAFAQLLSGYCHQHHTLKRIFGRIDDYTELLLPDNMLQDGGFLHLLNTTDAITEEDYQSVELIGWLYQFYISEKKDEVFAAFKKRKKAEAKDIPAATQIFTPNWIVKYMVENTAGKTWLDLNPDSPLKSKMKYLVENESDGEGDPIISSVEELTLMDPASGSGHILVEGFDLLYQMYLEEYYPPEEAVESILKNNLFGLDLDERATQLATFAVLLKAAKVFPDVWKKDWLPNIYPMPEPVSFSRQELKDFLGEEGEDYLEDLEDALRLMKQAKNLGSIMKFDLSNEALSYFEKRFGELRSASYREFNEEAVYQKIKPFIHVLMLLTHRYITVVANPPYMGQKNMNGELKSYVKANYPLSKSDLFAVFMETGLAMIKNEGSLGMINQHSWMFLSRYEKLRESLISTIHLDSLLHLGPRTFEELSGEVVQSASFVFKKTLPEDSKGTYYRLVDLNSNKLKRDSFLAKKKLYKKVSQSKLFEVPGTLIAYWSSDQVFNCFKNDKALAEKFTTREGMATADNNRFLRLWHEISFNSIETTCGSMEESVKYPRWFPYNKGGSFRKWYGNNEFCVEYANKGENIKNNIDERTGRVRSHNYNGEYGFKEGLTWSAISSGNISVRYSPKGFLFDSKGAKGFSDNNHSILGLLNSNTAMKFLEVLSPTLDFKVGDIIQIPFKDQIISNEIRNLVITCIKLSRNDWDSRETSWDFEESPLLDDVTDSIKQSYQVWFDKVSENFFQLHANEEELNRNFIDIYDLQDELSPEILLKDISILQEELDRKEFEQLEPVFREKGKEAIELPINKSEVISQFISYVVGLIMGRYRLDKPGLNIAHPDPTSEELSSYSYNGHTVEIDEDAIIPLMGSSCNFPDDAVNRFNQLLDVIWGLDTRTENINFIQDSLNKDLEKFMVKDFYKYHCSMYQKKPIYWLFSSKKGAFQVLVYLHRMNEFTAEKIRANYLLDHIKYLREEEALLAKDESSLSSKKARQLEQIRKDIHECEEYDMKLKDIADRQIKFDLDDGVKENYKLFKGVVAKIK